jgi:5,10-methylene-tetrahydrofolate dehydrogenase/methenyl tetrahydrofolate cyclohydrolase
MKTKLLLGTNYKKTLFKQIKKEISELRATFNEVPGITFIACTGHLPLMKYTIGLHEKAAKELGFMTRIEALPHTISNKDIIEVIDRNNKDESIHAIVLLQPVPKHLNALNLLDRIDSKKEIEGFHPVNVLETLKKGVFGSRYPMCLPTALMELFKSENVEVKPGQEFIFVADQDFLANPFRSLILRTASAAIVPSDCALTLVNSEHNNLMEFCCRADFIVVISEKPEFFKPEILKPNVVIVDIYSNLVREDAGKKDPNILIPVIKGGVDTNAVMGIAGKIAPCPGGLMPVLLAVLFRNALLAFKLSLNTENNKDQMSGIHPYNEIALNTESWKLT